MFPYLLWVVVSVVWGTTWVLIRVGLADLPPFTFAGVRTMIGAVTITLIAWVGARDRRPRLRDLPFWLFVGILNLGIPFAFVFVAEQKISSGLTAMIFGTYPAFTAVLAHYLLPAEPLSWRRVVAVGVATTVSR